MKNHQLNNKTRRIAQHQAINFGPQVAAKAYCTATGELSYQELPHLGFPKTLTMSTNETSLKSEARAYLTLANSSRVRLPRHPRDLDHL